MITKYQSLSFKMTAQVAANTLQTPYKALATCAPLRQLHKDTLQFSGSNGESSKSFLGRILGRGMEAVVYDLDDGKILKVPHKDIHSKWDLSATNLEPAEPEPKEWRNLTSIGRPMGTLKAMRSDGTIRTASLQSKVPGEKASIDYNLLNWGGTIPKGKEKEFDTRYQTYLEDADSLPSEAIEDLLYTVHQLDKSGHAIDPNANNLILDKGRKQFGIVDFKKTESAQKAQMCPPNEQNNIAYVTAMLTDVQIDKVRNKPATESEKRLRRSLIEKILYAAADMKAFRNSSVKLPSSRTFATTHKNDRVNNSFTPEEIFKAAGLNPAGWSAIRTALSTQRKENIDDWHSTRAIIAANL